MKTKGFGGMDKKEMLEAVADAQQLVNNVAREFETRTYSKQIQRRIDTIMGKLRNLKTLIQDQVNKWSGKGKPKNSLAFIVMAPGG